MNMNKKNLTQKTFNNIWNGYRNFYNEDFHTYLVNEDYGMSYFNSINSIDYYIR